MGIPFGQPSAAAVAADRSAAAMTNLGYVPPEQAAPQLPMLATAVPAGPTQDMINQAAATGYAPIYNQDGSFQTWQQVSQPVQQAPVPQFTPPAQQVAPPYGASAQLPQQYQVDPAIAALNAEMAMAQGMPGGLPANPQFPVQAAMQMPAQFGAPPQALPQAQLPVAPPGFTPPAPQFGQQPQQLVQPQQQAPAFGFPPQGVQPNPTLFPAQQPPDPQQLLQPHHLNADAQNQVNILEAQLKQQALQAGVEYNPPARRNLVTG